MMDGDGAFDYFFSNPVLAQFALLVCLFVSVLSPRLLIMGVGAFLGAVLSLIAAALFGLWSMATFPLLAIGTLGGLFVGWRRTGRVRWLWFSGPKRRIAYCLLGLLFVSASIATLFSTQIGDYRLMRRLIAAEQPDRLMMLKRGDLPAMDDVPFLLDRFHADERGVLFEAMLTGSDFWRWEERPGYSELIHWAVDTGDRSLVVVSLNWLRKNRDSSSSWLAEQDWSQDEVRLLIESGLDVLEKDRNDFIFAEQLIVRNRLIAHLFWPLLESIPNLLEIVTSDSNRTYLELLAYEDQHLILARLHDSGIDLAGRDRSGRTLLHHLAMGSKGGASIPTLVRAGIDVNGPDNYKMLALHHAAYRNEDLAKRFLGLSCPINAPNKKGETPLYLAIYFDRDIPALNLPDAQRWLQYDNHAGIEIAQALLDFGADPCLVDRWGNSALHYASMKKTGDHLSLDIVEMLLEHGADPFLANKNGSTPQSALTSRLHDSSGYYGPASDIEDAIDLLKKAEEDRNAARRP